MNSISIYIDNKSLLIFTYHRVCFNSIDDDDDEATGKINHYSTKTYLKRKKSQMIQQKT
jgi:hypothetical protein